MKQNLKNETKSLLLGLCLLILSSCGNMGVTALESHPGSSFVEAVEESNLDLLDYAPSLKIMVGKYADTEAKKASFKAFTADMVAKVKEGDQEFYATFKESLSGKVPALREQALQEGLQKLRVQLKLKFGDRLEDPDFVFNQIFKEY